jgi:hypothetical protein
MGINTAGFISGIQVPKRSILRGILLCKHIFRCISFKIIYLIILSFLMPLKYVKTEWNRILVYQVYYFAYE